MASAYQSEVRVKKSTSLLLALALTGGLLTTALVGSASADTADPQSVTIDHFAFKVRKGNFVGRVTADRPLCLYGRSVTILKDLGTTNKRITKAVLNFDSYSATNHATFRTRHPAMDIERRRARQRALAGTYIAKLAATTVLDYATTYSCLGSKLRLKISF